MNKLQLLNFKFWKFTHSRFYRWSRIIVCAAAILGAPAFRGDTTIMSLYCYAAAAAYSVIPPILAIGGDYAQKSEAFQKSSQVVGYLRTLFEDIAHINEVNGEYGHDFFAINFILSNQGDSYAHLMLGESYDETIQIFKELFDADPDNEIMKKNYREALSYERNGYIAKNTSFKNELLCKSIGEFTRPTGCNGDDLWFSITLRSFADVMALETGMRDAAASVICTLALEQHFKVNYDKMQSDGKRVVGIVFN